MPFVLYVLFTKQKLADILYLNAPTTKNVLFAILLGITFVPIIVLSSILVPMITAAIFPNTGFDAAAIAGAAPTLGILILAGAVFPAIFEEILFRGAFFNQYFGHKNGVSIWKTAFVTALFFGLIHGNIIQLLYAIPFGLVFAFSLYYTRSIWIPVITHFVANALSFMLASAQPPQINGYYEVMQYANDYTATGGMNPVIAMLAVFGGLSVVMLPLMILCMRKFKKYYTKTQSTEEVTTTQKVYTWEFWIVVAIWVVFSIVSGLGVI